MKLIVSSRYSVEMIDIALGLRSPLRICSNDLLYYGITWSDELMFLGKRWLLTNQQAIEVLDLNLGHLRTILHDSELYEIHQIAWHNGRLYVANSGMDQIVICDEYGKGIEIWRPVGPTDRDTRHLNSIWFENDRIYIVAHNRAASDLLVFSEERERLAEYHGAGRASHNVARVAGDLVVLNSQEGTVWRHNKPPVHLGREGTYPRGLAVTDDFVFVGVSEYCNYREERHKLTMGAVDIYNPQWDCLDSFELTMGMVHEVRVLDTPDYAHHGQVWKGRMAYW